MDVCTIIAKNYVAQARVLARSFAEHHPDGGFWTLIIDDFSGHIDPSQEPFEVLTPSDIGCEPFYDMAVRYNVLELSTAVKPWLLAHLMREVSGPVTYLDPDIRVFDTLEPLAELARLHGVVVTPHNSEPIPADGKRPSQIDIMIAGVYNLGYVTMAPGEDTERLLAWWSDRLRRDCRVDPVYGYFVDQRWFDLVPGFVSDYWVMRDPQYNVAYWNLHSRALQGEGRHYTVDGRPLAFFHFSGFDPESPSILSRHQNRVEVAEHSALATILEEYAAATLEEGYATAKRWPYTFEVLPDGVPMDSVVRKLYGEAEICGEVSDSPFTPAGHRAFVEWLGASQPGAPVGVNRLLAHLYGSRTDLRDAFPDLDGPDLARLLRWSQDDGVREVPMLAKLPLSEEARRSLAEEPAPPPSSSTTQQPAAWGVNVVGYFRSELGVGEVARQVIGALDTVDVPTLPINSELHTLSRQGHVFSQLGLEDAAFPVNLICVNADMLPELARRAGKRFFAGRYSIGMWFWEISQFPAEWQASFELVDEVWAPTAHVADALARISPIPVVPATIPVQVPAIVPRSRAELGVPEGFLFLFSFDYLSVFERKNPLAVIEAFARAFAPGEGASLVVKCINTEHDPLNHERLLAAADAHPDIHVVDRYLESADKDALSANCDCYVSLHRSEGFGLTMAEAMYLGKPVIATGYSGNLDFMTPANSLLVDYALVPIGPDAPPYPADGEWAEPSREHAAALMRTVFDDRTTSAALGLRGAQDIRRTHSPAVAGERMRERLIRVSEDASRHHAASANGGSGSGSGVAGLDHLVRRGPVPSPGKRGPVARAARRGALRAMRPFAAYQEGVNTEVVNALDSVAETLSGVHDRLVGASAAVLALNRSQDGFKTLPNVIGAHSRAIDGVKDTLTELGGRMDRVDRAVHAQMRLETDRGVYAALATLAERHRGISDRPGGSAAVGPLTPYELRVFSQNGEDGVLAEILARVGTGERFFVEFGVESGREGNCVALADVFGWRGVFLDCDEVFFPELERKYRANEAVVTRQAMVTPENAEQLFAECGVPSAPDVLSIDVDGGDYWIWEAIEAYQPRVLVVEYNSALDPGRCLVQPREHDGGWDGTDCFGASLGAMRSLGERKGYRLVHAELSGVNAFFVRADLAAGRFPEGADVRVPGCPNYFQLGRSHPRFHGEQRYLDLESGELVSVDS
jgi:glycosyltransferase involved in cell wall biosynthesis